MLYAAIGVSFGRNFGMTGWQNLIPRPKLSCEMRPRINPDQIHQMYSTLNLKSGVDPRVDGFGVGRHRKSHSYYWLCVVNGFVSRYPR